jgi:hypothetical protein
MLGLKGKPGKERAPGPLLGVEVFTYQIFSFSPLLRSFFKKKIGEVYLYIKSIYCKVWVRYARDRGRGRCQGTM